jgi:hypothetical protein
MQTRSHSDGLWIVGRRYWRYFIFVWLWPIYFYASWLLGAALELTTRTQSLLYFALVEVPPFFLCFHIARKPYIKRLITPIQAIFWSIIVPLAIWTFLVFLPFALFHFLG